MSNHPRITLDSLHKGEQDRLNAIRARAEVALAKSHPQLKSITVQHLLNDELLSEPRVFHHVVSGSDLEIRADDEQAISALVSDLVTGSEIAQRNIAFASAELRAKLEQDFYSSLKPGEALLFERAGELQQRRDAFVEEGLSRA